MHPKYRNVLSTVYLLGVSLARRRFAAERRTPAKGLLGLVAKASP